MSAQPYASDHDDDIEVIFRTEQMRITCIQLIRSTIMAFKINPEKIYRGLMIWWWLFTTVEQRVTVESN